MIKYKQIGENKPLATGPQGFTLVEVLVTVAIVGILSAIALPNYLNSLQRTRQSDVVGQLTQAQTTIQAYADEFLTAPKGWSDLTRLAPVMGENGPVTAGSFSAFDSPNGANYSISAEISGSAGNTITITATPKQVSLANWNVIACVNTSNGVSQVKRGSGESPAASVSCPDTSS